MDFSTCDARVGKYTVSVIEDDQYIGACLRRGFEWDGWMRHDLPQLTDPNKDILDIGGNIGWNALMFSEYAPVHTFEPYFHPILRKNIDQNTLAHPVTLHAYGLSNVNSESEFWVPIKNGDVCNYGGSSVHGSTGHEQVSTKIGLKRLDDVYSGVPSLMKIDVEGHELEVLKGAEQTIRRHRPHLYVEIFDFDTNPTTQFIQDLGYTQVIPRPEHNYLFIHNL